MPPRTLIALASLAVLAANPAALRAQPPDGPDDMPPGPPMMMRSMPGGGDAPGMVIPLMLRRSNLSDAQREKVRALMRANRAELRALFERLRSANDALASRLIGPGPVDAATLKPDVERVARARQELMDHGLTIALALRGILTPEQLKAVTEKRAKLEDLQQQMRELMRE